MSLQSSQKNVKVSVERLLEREVDQIGRHGEETYIKPFSLSEELSYFASKIDFHGTHENVVPTDDDSKKSKLIVDEENGQSKPKGESLKETKWPWETVHSKLRIALSEVCVMLDVLECLHRKKYLVLDPVHQSTEPNKQTVKMLGSCKCLAQVGALIKRGANNLTYSSLKNELNNDAFSMQNDKVDEYYIQLMHLRQYWRVKKTGPQITGDVTYRSVGSHFWHPGLLEVKAAHKSGSALDQRKLIVNISPDLMQSSRLTVEIVDSFKQAPWTASTDLATWRRSNTFDWENNLQLAQIHLFNLEIFSILSNDAFQGSYNNIEVLDSRICCRILEGVEVYISHHVGNPRLTDHLSNKVSANDLTLVLSNLLLQHHSKNLIQCSLFPATSVHRQKPLRSSSFHNVLNKSFITKECMLNSFLDKARHKIWVHRLSNFLDYKAKSVKNSILIPHWNSIKYKLMSSVTILVVTKSFVATIKSSISVTIADNHFNVALGNGEKLTIPCNIGMLQELFDLELQSHMVRIANSLCLEHGWSVIQTSSKYSAMLLPNETRIVNGSIFFSPIHQKSIKLFVYSVDRVEIKISEHMVGSLTILDVKFKLLDIKYTVLPYTQFPGRTFTEKIESLLLCL